MFETDDLNTILAIRESATKVGEILKNPGTDLREEFLFGWSSCQLTEIIAEIERAALDYFPEEAKKAGFSDNNEVPFSVENPDFEQLIIYIEDFKEKVDRLAQIASASEISPVSDTKLTEGLKSLQG